MPEDNLPDVRRAISGQFYREQFMQRFFSIFIYSIYLLECPRGHPYLVTEVSTLDWLPCLVAGFTLCLCSVADQWLHTHAIVVLKLVGMTMFWLQLTLQQERKCFSFYDCKSRLNNICLNKIIWNVL